MTPQRTRAVSLSAYRRSRGLSARQELEEEEEDAGDGGIDAGEGNDTDEEVEILVSFEEDGREYHLVRLLDPVLLVGKVSLPPRRAAVRAPPRRLPFLSC